MLTGSAELYRVSELPSIPLSLIKKITSIEIKLLRLFFKPAIYLVDKFLSYLAKSGGAIHASANYLLSLTLTLTVSLPMLLQNAFWHYPAWFDVVLKPLWLK